MDPDIILENILRQKGLINYFFLVPDNVEGQFDAVFNPESKFEDISEFLDEPIDNELKTVGGLLENSYIKKIDLQDESFIIEHYFVPEVYKEARRFSEAGLFIGKNLQTEEQIVIGCGKLNIYINPLPQEIANEELDFKYENNLIGMNSKTMNSFMKTDNLIVSKKITEAYVIAQFADALKKLARDYNGEL